MKVGVKVKEYNKDGQKYVGRRIPKTPVAVKLLGLAVYGVLMYNISGVYLLLLFLPSLLFFLRVSVAFIKQLIILVGIVSLVNLVFSGAEYAAYSALRMSALLAGAYTVSRTTRFSEFLNFFIIVATPLRVFGLNQKRVGLTLSMTVRFVPEILTLHTQVREAQIARGVQKKPLAIFLPFTVLSLNMAQEIATAIASRGFED